MVPEMSIYAYCKEDPKLIENYEKAVNDPDNVWVVHHRLEIRDGYTNSRKDLKLMGLYYHRPAAELVLLLSSEHTKLHSVNRPSQRKWTDAEKKAISERLKGRTVSAETRRKLSVAAKARTDRVGHPCSERSREATRVAHAGKHFYNDGKHSILAYTCPEGYIPGVLRNGKT